MGCLCLAVMMQTHWFCAYSTSSSETPSLRGNPPLILLRCFCNTILWFRYIYRAEALHSASTPSLGEAFLALFSSCTLRAAHVPSGCDNQRWPGEQQPPAAPWDGPKFLVFLQGMSFSDRRIWLKCSTLVFLSDVAQALSP